jgi:hypothetical protein
VNSHKVASRSYNPYPQPHQYSPVSFRNKSIVNNVGNEKHTQGVVKRGGATVKWLSAEQNIAKMESMKRHEEQLHKAEKHRVMQHAQIQHAPTHSSPNSKRYQPTTNKPKVISVQGTEFEVTSGGSKLVRLSGVLDPILDSVFAHSTLTDEPALAMATPKQISVNGVPFTRSKNGNLIRTKAIKQGSVKQNHQCQGNRIQSSLIPINRLSKTNDKTKLCRRYTSTGTSLSPTISQKKKRSFGLL